MRVIRDYINNEHRSMLEVRVAKKFVYLLGTEASGVVMKKVARVKYNPHQLPLRPDQAMVTYDRVARERGITQSAKELLSEARASL